MAIEELERNDQLTIGTDAVVVSEQCFQKRTVIILTNISTAGQSITVRVGAGQAELGKGIPVPVGGAYFDTRDGQYFPSQAQITAIASAAGGTLAIHERILMKTGF